MIACVHARTELTYLPTTGIKDWLCVSTLQPQILEVVEKIISFTSGALFEKFTYCDSFLYNANTENQLFIKPYSD